MIERPRIFDWRFLAMLAFLLMVSYLVLTGVTAIQQNAEKGRQIDSLIAAGERANADATRQRDDLLAAQRRLLSRLDAYDARQRALLAYLRRHGIDIPTRFVEVPVADQPVGPPRPNTGGPATPPPIKPPLTPPTSAPTGPGNSDGHANPPGPKKPKKASRQHGANRH